MKNAAGRELPEYIPYYGAVKPYAGAFASPASGSRAPVPQKNNIPGQKKLLGSIREAIIRSGLKDGMTVSFHQHYRNGDRLVNLVMGEIAAMGFHDIRLAASGLYPCHEPLVRLMEEGVITQIAVNTFNRGPVADAISHGKLQKPAVFMSHGGRPRAIEAGSLHIDVAFIAAPSCDELGNMNGTSGPSACGYLSYAYPDAEYAGVVVAVTDNLVPYPNCPVEISQDKVDYVVCVDCVGDPKGIVSGTTRVTSDPIRLGIAANAARLIDAAGCIRQGMSFQTGAGGTSLAVAADIHKMMLQRGIKGSFGAGGITKYLVRMLDEGLFRALFDVQCFDLEAVASAAADPRHMAMSASLYANPHNAGCIVHGLDVVVLGASEIDLDFNVNVITGSDGVILGASGGHCDTAAGAKFTVIVANLTRKNICVVRDRVTTVTTPGETVDALVTEAGIAINPRRTDILEAVRGSGLPIVDIARLREIGEELAGPQKKPEFTDRIAGIVEYRDGTVIDLVYQVK